MKTAKKVTPVEHQTVPTKGLQPVLPRTGPPRVGRVSRPLLRENARKWRDHETVTCRRGVFKNLGYNPCGYTIDRHQPLKYRGCLNVNPKTLRAHLGKRRTVDPTVQDLEPKRSQDSFYYFCISSGKLGLKPSDNYRRAFSKNLSFLGGGKKSCKQLKYVVHFITENGITVRLYRKLSLALLLVMCGKPGRAHKIYRSVSNRCGTLRNRSMRNVQEPSLSDSSYYSDW